MNARLEGDNDDITCQEFLIVGGPMDGGIMEIPTNLIPELLKVGLILKKDEESQKYELDYLNGILKATS